MDRLTSLSIDTIRILSPFNPPSLANPCQLIGSLTSGWNTTMKSHKDGEAIDQTVIGSPSGAEDTEAETARDVYEGGQSVKRGYLIPTASHSFMAL
jgi:hypothetical protein